jgi:AraC-like DNA-binding protein
MMGANIVLKTVQMSVYPSQMITLCRRGGGLKFCRGVSLPIEEGDAFVIAPHEVWGYALDDRPKTWNGSIRLPNDLGTLLPPGADGRPRVDFLPPGVALQRLPGAARRFAGPMRRFFEARDRDAEMAVMAEIADLVASSPGREEDRIARPATPMPKSVRTVLQRMEPDLPARLNLRELAAELGMPAGRLINEFDQWFGMTPHQYLLARRLTVGLATLSARGPIGEAVGVGAFADQAHLTRLFKTVYGNTPGRWAKWVSQRSSAARR